MTKTDAFDVMLVLLWAQTACTLHTAKVIGVINFVLERLKKCTEDGFTATEDFGTTLQPADHRGLYLLTADEC